MKTFIRIVRILLGIPIAAFGIAYAASDVVFAWSTLGGAFLTLIGAEIAGLPVTKWSAAMIGSATGAMTDGLSGD